MEILYVYALFVPKADLPVPIASGRYMRDGKYIASVYRFCISKIKARDLCLFSIYKCWIRDAITKLW